MDVHSSSYNLRMMKEKKKWMCEWNGFFEWERIFLACSGEWESGFWYFLWIFWIN
jgi:hypothetical protein